MSVSAEAKGFMQVSHGKAAPLRRIHPGDWVVYYSPTTAKRNWGFQLRFGLFEISEHDMAMIATAMGVVLPNGR
jgi:hypothetical protein